MTRRGEGRSVADQAAFLLLLLLLIWLPWPWASVGRSAQGLIAVMTGAALLLSMVAAEGGKWPQTAIFRIANLIWLIWISWILFSLVPLPESVLRNLSPYAADLHAAVRGLGVQPAWTISVEPASTKRALLQSLNLWGMYLLAARTVNSEFRKRVFLVVLAATASAQALYGLGMTLTNVEIGFFEKKVYGLGWATGTFVNRNHFAHFLALGAAAALALLLAQRNRDATRGGWRGRLLRVISWIMSPAAVWRVSLLVMLSAVVLSQSRMGNVSIMVSLIAGVLIWVVLYDRAKILPAVLLLTSFAVADLWIVNQYYGLSRVVDRIEDTELETEQRSVALRELTPLFDEFAVVGSGVGSFQSVFLAAQSRKLRGLYDHAHNEYAETMVETGFLGLFSLIGMGALHFLHALGILRGRKQAVARAIGLTGVVALIAAGLHATVDFIFHIPATFFWLVAILGALAATRRSSGRSRAPEMGDNLPIDTPLSIN